MAFNLFRWIIEAMNPCIHQFDVTCTMHDNPEKPANTRIVKTCAICGESKVEDYQLPGWNKPCQHRWEIIRRVAVYGKNPTIMDNKPIPRGYDYEQRCTTCGDIKVTHT